tara:strand:+ start:273 stop:470 length:198 start_codon:yes stop_codon:yes gene_type:complete
MADIKTTSQITNETDSTYDYSKSNIEDINETFDQTICKGIDGAAIIYLKQKIDELIAEVNTLKNA